MMNFKSGNFFAISIKTIPIPPPTSNIIDPVSKLSQGNPEDQNSSDSKTEIGVELSSHHWA
jgi:hypothetical protein